MLVHASASEYKDQLYPVIGNWYHKDICIERINDYRYIRYVKGDTEAFRRNERSDGKCAERI